MIKRYKLALVILLPLAVMLLSMLVLEKDVAVLSPKGLIALKQRDLLVTATLLMLIVVIPVFIFTYVFAWRYRASNKKAKYTPDWGHSHLYESIWWAIPCAIVVALSIITWKSSHELDPYKPLDSDIKPIRIQVVALQWKWLFIYPEYNIATINFIQFPEKTPINFEITSDAPMNSFWIPELAGQIYAMPGMKTKLHLIADVQGDFTGSSANLSGLGFSGMTFIAKASSEDDFYKWLQSIKETPQFLGQLGLDEYLKLVEPSMDNKATYYSLKKEDLFDWIVMKYMMPM
jgi:cytochrome o ubiquinol oxidase subunit 2